MTLTSVSSTTCECMETFTIKFWSICMCKLPRSFVKDTIELWRGFLLLNKMWILHQWTEKICACTALRTLAYWMSWKERIISNSSQDPKIKNNNNNKKITEWAKVDFRNNVVKCFFFQNKVVSSPVLFCFVLLALFTMTVIFLWTPH